MTHSFTYFISPIARLINIMVLTYGQLKFIHLCLWKKFPKYCFSDFNLTGYR